MNTEAQDLEILKQEIAQLKDKSYSMLQIMVGPTFTPQHAGHTSVGGALLYEVQTTLKKIEALAKAHEKKWPSP